MVNHDIHVHTYLSSCASKDAFMADYINTAKELGIETIGFTDHCWDENIAGASDWYKPQTYKRLEERKAQLKEMDTQGINVLLGAEGEYAKEILCITEDALNFTDYIIVPHSHTHMKGIVISEECADNPNLHAKYLLNSFLSLCGHEKRNLFFGIAHPMYPIGKNLAAAEEIYSYISDDNLKECAIAAKEAAITLELNLSVAKNIMKESKETTCYHRFFEICQKAGCELFMGSDAHSISAFKERHDEKNSAMQYFNMAENDFTIAKLRKQNG